MRLKAKKVRQLQLLKWRAEQYEKITPKQLAESLSSEALPWEPGIPMWLAKALIEFRHLRTDARVAACRAFLAA